MQQYDFTQPYYEENFQLVTMSGDPPFQFMSWASPFDYTLWIALGKLVDLIELALTDLVDVFSGGNIDHGRHVYVHRGLWHK